MFQAAPAIGGGREFLQDDNQPERGAIASPGGYNNFQARYIIRHEWTGPIECEEPQRGIWGEPWEGSGNPRAGVIGLALLGLLGLIRVGRNRRRNPVIRRSHPSCDRA